MRLHAPEIEDEAWCPSFLRDGLTDFLAASSDALGLYDGATPIVAGLVRRNGAKRLVDLCSGGGGPTVRLRAGLARDHGLDVEAILTDLYPNMKRRHQMPTTRRALAETKQQRMWRQSVSVISLISP